MSLNKSHIHLLIVRAHTAPRGQDVRQGSFWHSVTCPDTGSPLSDAKLSPGETGVHLCDEVVWYQVTYHGKADICLFKSWPIVGAISSHGHHLPLLTSCAVDNAWNTEWVRVGLKLSAKGWYGLLLCSWSLMVSSSQALMG